MHIIKTLTAFAVIMSAMLLCGAECYGIDEEISFGFSVSGSTLSVHLYESDNADYSLSINGGKTFIPFNGEATRILSGLPSGCYQLRLMKNDDKSTLTENTAVFIGSGRVAEEDELSLSVTSVTESSIGQGGIKIKLLNALPTDRCLYSVNGGRTWKYSGFDRSIEVNGLYSGTYQVVVKSIASQKYSECIEIQVPTVQCGETAYIPVTAIKQLPELPTGCEVTSLAMVLSSYGLNVSKTALADVFLPKAAYRTADYRKYFVGNPREIWAYGCYAGVIKECAEKYLATIPSRTFDVVNITGCEPDTLYSYLDMGYPLVVWATGNLGATSAGPVWTDTETGETIEWVGNEHCMTLIGYNKRLSLVFVNDPMYGMRAYDMELFELRFEEMEKQAVLIVETTDN